MSKLPYLFYIDTNAVNTAFQNQSKLFPLYSELYKEAKRLNMDFSLAQLNELISHYTGFDREQSLNNLIKRNLLDKMGKVEFGGVELKREAIANMIIIPDLDSLKSLMQQICSVNYYSHLVNIELADIDSNGNITLKSNANEILTQKHSVYADNEKQVTFYEKAKACSEAMNIFVEFSKEKFTESRPTRGVIFDTNTNKYAPDVAYIKQYIRE